MLLKQWDRYSSATPMRLVIVMSQRKSVRLHTVNKFLFLNLGCLTNLLINLTGVWPETSFEASWVFWKQRNLTFTAKLRWINPLSSCHTLSDTDSEHGGCNEIFLERDHRNTWNMFLCQAVFSDQKLLNTTCRKNCYGNRCQTTSA